MEVIASKPLFFESALAYLTRGDSEEGSRFMADHIWIQVPVQWFKLLFAQAGDNPQLSSPFGPALHWMLFQTKSGEPFQTTWFSNFPNINQCNNIASTSELIFGTESTRNSTYAFRICILNQRDLGKELQALAGVWKACLILYFQNVRNSKRPDLFMFSMYLHWRFG